MRNTRKWRRALAVVSAMAIVAGGAMFAAVAGASSPDQLKAVQASTASFHSFEQAEKAGYSIVGEPCVASPLGTMGIHAVNKELMDDPALDALRPEILLYVPKADGALELVGVEYWKADADGDLGTAGDRPSVLGHEFDGPMPGHTPTMPVHYDLHVWLWRDNPSGLFAPFNPNLSCS